MPFTSGLNQSRFFRLGCPILKDEKNHPGGDFGKGEVNPITALKKYKFDSKNYFSNLQVENFPHQGTGNLLFWGEEA